MLPAAKPQHLAASGILERAFASQISRSATSLHFSPVEIRVLVCIGIRGIPPFANNAKDGAPADGLHLSPFDIKPRSQLL